jgi:hypothetical protein
MKYLKEAKIRLNGVLQIENPENSGIIKVTYPPSLFMKAQVVGVFFLCMGDS